MICEDVTWLAERDFEAEAYAEVDIAGVRATYEQYGADCSDCEEDVGPYFNIEVQGEIVSRYGLSFTKDAELQVVCLDDSDRVISIGKHRLREGQGGYHAFSENFGMNRLPSKIKIKVLRR